MNLGQRTTTGVTSGFMLTQPNNSVQCVVVGTGAVTASIDVEVSNNGVHFFKHGATQSLSGTTSASSILPLTGFFRFVRINVTAISGTGATASGIVASA